MLALVSLLGGLIASAAPTSYDHSLEPLQDMLFEWSIRDNAFIDCRLTRSNTLGWFGMGLSEKNPYSMGYADFWLTLHSINYTGVFDLWRPSNSNGYPCWDVLCNDCGPICGTQNLLDRETSRTGTTTVSTWSRALEVDDPKDWNITTAGNHLLFAYGDSDWFYQHAKNQAVMMRVDLFTGKTYTEEDWVEKEKRDFGHGTGRQEPEEPPKGKKVEEGAAPVFIRRDLDGDHLVRPTGQCMPCLKYATNKDGSQKCMSAVVECHPDQGAVETLFSEEKCAGEILSVTKVDGSLPQSRLQCPDEEFYSVKNLDLERFVSKLLKEQGPLFNDSEELVRGAIEEYRKMLLLAQTHPELSLVPSALVDQVWHAHILDTQAYARDSQRILGRFMHHAPSFDNEEGSQEQAELKQAQEEMFEHYVATFGEEPPKDFWPHFNSHGDTPTLGYNSCCSGSCVKPGCTSCVGCNAIYCGTFWSTDLVYPPL